MGKENLKEYNKSNELREKRGTGSNDIDEIYPELNENNDHSKMTEEDVNKINDIFEGDETLSEDFKNKASTLFESMVSEKVQSIEKEKEDKLNEEIEKLEEKTDEYINDVVLPKIDEYVTYVAEEWMKENELAVENGIQSEISESFMTSLKNVFKEHYLEIPEDKIDVVEEQRKEIENLKNSLNEKIDENRKFKKDIQESSKNEMIEEAVKNLSEIEADRVRKLAENIHFDENTFSEKLNVITESITDSKQKGSSPEEMINENFDEDEVKNPQMKRYLEALKKLN